MPSACDSKISLARHIAPLSQTIMPKPRIHTGHSITVRMESELRSHVHLSVSTIRSTPNEKMCSYGLDTRQDYLTRCTAGAKVLQEEWVSEEHDRAPSRQCAFSLAPRAPNRYLQISLWTKLNRWTATPIHWSMYSTTTGVNCCRKIANLPSIIAWSCPLPRIRG